MKKNILVLICFCCFNSSLTIAQTNKNLVEIRGTLAHFSNEVEVEDMSELQYLLPKTIERLVVPDAANGQFYIKFKITAPNYFRIGRNALYLSPGDNLKVFIDYNNPTVAIFEGRGSEANHFLRFTPFPKGGSYMEAGTKAQPTPQQTIDYILSAAALRTRQLDSLKTVTAEFKRLEKGRIQADIINSLLDGQISFYRPRAIQKDSVKLKQYGDEYAALIKPYVDKYLKDFTEASFLKLVVYRDLADTLSTQHGKVKDLQQIKDWLQATAIIEKLKLVSDKQLLENFKPEIKTIKTAPYRNAVNQSFSALLQFGKGDTAADFTATDTNGKTIALSSLKGKVIYIDLWATWCGPCMQEMPHYETLKEKYASNPNIVFISLSIEDNETLWKGSVSGRKATGYQWLVNRNKLNAYNIVGIPRTLLIGKDFKMVDMNAPLPSSKKITGIIDGLLQ
ncbi:TlpA family protein disulfide reductase [Ferruginibacter sp. SUN106]|uniref:TlpA family protein disulfide reductase n=1 Tax=Ferruginibacter sp. SUN106 TaxID=2978348 RepID=UPI003D3628FB